MSNIAGTTDTFLLALIAYWSGVTPGAKEFEWPFPELDLGQIARDILELGQAADFGIYDDMPPENPLVSAKLHHDLEILANRQFVSITGKYPNQKVQFQPFGIVFSRLFRIPEPILKVLREEEIGGV